MIKPWIAKKQCTGCGACANICPQNAIKMQKDDSGFLYPHIIDSCIECGKCRTVCNTRIEEKKESNDLIIYAAWSKDERIRFLSTSGGIFSELALAVIDMGGLVSGAQYTDDCLVEHEIVDDALGLERLRQSKYVQSDMKNIYRKIKQYLKDNNKILFCGTPCQVAALRAYLQKDESNLYTIDFICMGVNSPKAYLAWILEIEKEQNKKVQKVWFKYKKRGWKKSPFVTKICFIDGTWIDFDDDNNKYMQGFLQEKIFIRPCCGACQFKGIFRQADLTLGDFWGVDKTLDDDKGTSIVMINSKKGEELFYLASPRIKYYKRTIEDVIQGNEHLCKSVEISKNEDKFFSNLENMNFSASLKKIRNI